MGVAGGTLIGSKILGRQKRVLGVRVPAKVDFSGMTHQIGEAGRQFGKLAVEVQGVAGEVRAAREKAEKIGKVLS